MMQRRTIKVLLAVDEMPDDAWSVQKMLGDVERPRFEVEWVHTLDQTFAHLVRHKPNVLLLERSLPGSHVTGTAMQDKSFEN
jgi:DNA-binding response OmpR family regulator